jgi:hypothetical protein
MSEEHRERRRLALAVSRCESVSRAITIERCSPKQSEAERRGDALHSPSLWGLGGGGNGRGQVAWRDEGRGERQYGGGPRQGLGNAGRGQRQCRAQSRDNGIAMAFALTTSIPHRHIRIASRLSSPPLHMPDRARCSPLPATPRLLPLCSRAAAAAAPVPRPRRARRVAR